MPSWGFLCGLALALLPTMAWALPVVSVDADPTTTGIQDSRDVLLGSSFEIDIVISGVEASAPLNGFELDLLFDSAIVTATSVADGGFLLDPVLVVQESVGAVSVEFAEITLGPFGASGSGVLATLSFDTAGLGFSDLLLENVLLSAPFGQPIPTQGIADGFVNVVEATNPPSTPIPEPRAAALFGLGAVVCAMTLRRRKRLL